MRIQINSTPALIGIRNQRPVQTMEQPRGEQSIRQTKAEMIVDQELPRVHIDQSQCFAEVGLKSVMELAYEAAQLGRQAVLEGTARVAQEGDRMARLEDGASARAVLADLGEGNAYQVLDYNIDLAPKSRPRIEVTGHLKIDWKLGGVEHHYTPRQAITRYEPGKAEIYLRQWPSIEIRFLDIKA